jgi:hypothetical protein
MDFNPQITAHYGHDDIYSRILAALREAGIDPAAVTIENLAPVDQFHTGAYPPPKRSPTVSRSPQTPKSSKPGVASVAQRASSPKPTAATSSAWTSPQNSSTQQAHSTSSSA